MFGGLVRRFRREMDHAPILHFRKRKAGVGSTDVDCYELGRQLLLPFGTVVVPLGRA